MRENTCVYKDVVNPVEPNKTNFSVKRRLHFIFVIFLLWWNLTQGQNFY